MTVTAPIAIEIGTNADRPPFPCAPTYTGSGPIFETMNLSTNCMSVYDVIVATVGAATARSSRNGRAGIAGDWAEVSIVRVNCTGGGRSDRPGATGWATTPVQ